MVGSRQAGFTIVEVTLFLGITGLLFLIALAGTGGVIRSYRFADSGRALEAFVQKQYDDILNGLNTRSAAISCTSGAINTTTGQTVGTSNCFLIGKLLVMRQGNGAIGVYDVIGTEPANVNFSLSDTALISSYTPRAVTQTGVDTYNVPWSAYFSGFKRPSDNQAVNGLLLIRSPKSSRIVSYTFKVPLTVPTDLTTLVGVSGNIGQTVNFCIKNADSLGPPAKLVVTGGATQSAAKITFDSNDGECNGI